MSVKIDLDWKVTPCRWAKWCDRTALVLPLLSGPVRGDLVRVRRSPSGGAHVHLELSREVDPVVVVAIQAILGSDPKREALNLDRAQRGVNANTLHDHRGGAEWGADWPAGRASLIRALATAGHLV